MKLVACTKAHRRLFVLLRNEEIKALLGLSRERYTYVFYIRIDEAKCKLKLCLKLCFSKSKCTTKDIETEVKP